LTSLLILLTMVFIISISGCETIDEVIEYPTLDAVKPFPVQLQKIPELEKFSYDQVLKVIKAFSENLNRTTSYVVRLETYSDALEQYINIITK
jgi:hypothetical protein